ncbi:hypothetical protein EV679_1764 [Kerstersia gyiorum]|uniref:Uncharacterized protein n=2 Tax=Kerstersia gyiorum TaxID=206506 RepID=A0A4Q7MP35_9BURK|nr:hypothetical protein EV679_1764 [Kerstersia gyiorum]
MSKVKVCRAGNGFFVLKRTAVMLVSSAALLALPVQAQTSDDEICDAVAFLSRSTMHVRQHGVSLEELLAAHAASSTGYGGQQALVQAIARNAYEEPEAVNEAGKSQAVETFGEKWRKLCLADVPQP